MSTDQFEIMTSAIADLVGCVPYCNSFYPADRFLGTHHAHAFLEASCRSLTTPMHTDRPKWIGMIQILSAADDGQR